MTDQLFMRFTNVHFGAIVDHLEKIFPTLPPIAWAGGGKPSLMFLGATDLVSVKNTYSAEFVFRDKTNGGALLYLEIRESQTDTASLLVAWTNTTLRHAKELIVHLCIETGNPIPPKLAQMPYPPMKTMRTLGAIEYLKPDVFPVKMVEPVKQSNKSPSSPREDNQIKTTAAHYAITEKKELQDVAAQLVGTSDKTYRKYRNKGWLLSGEAFKKLTGETLATYWTKTSGKA